MAHPILRIARLKYHEGSVEQKQVLRFLNARCIKEGFESEEDYFGSDLTLAQWTRDARQWATICWKPSQRFAKNYFTKQAKKHLIERELFTTSVWAQTLPMLTHWMQLLPL
jgi:hypothetical protein